MKRVTVFGGSRPRPGEPDYEQAQRLGALLGKAGYTVQTGGYIGSMEAVSRGAAESGGRVIGMTCDEIEHWRPVRANAWVQEERRFATLKERLNGLIEENDAALALPGGPGTLTEIMLMWNLLLIGALPPRPLILIGPGWQETFQQFYRSFDNYIPESQRTWLYFVSSVDAAVERLKQQL